MTRLRPILRLAGAVLHDIADAVESLSEPYENSDLFAARQALIREGVERDAAIRDRDEARAALAQMRAYSAETETERDRARANAAELHDALVVAETAAADARAESRQHRERAEANLEAIARKLKLQLPNENKVSAILLDIGRLLDTETRWSQACEIARLHCPVSDGESHIRVGIPRLRERADAAERDSREWQSKALGLEHERDAVARTRDEAVARAEAAEAELAKAVAMATEGYTRGRHEGITMAAKECGAQADACTESHALPIGSRLHVAKALWDMGTHLSDLAADVAPDEPAPIVVPGLPPCTLCSNRSDPRWGLTVDGNHVALCDGCAPDLGDFDACQAVAGRVRVALAAHRGSR